MSVRVVFSKYLLEGMRGATDADQDGQITLRELTDFVTPRVTRESSGAGRHQTPQLAVGSRLGDPKDVAVVWGIR